MSAAELAESHHHLQADLEGRYPKYLTGAVAKMLRVTDKVVRDNVGLMGLDVERGYSGRKARLFRPEDVFRIAQFRRARGHFTWSHKTLSIVVYSAKGGVGKTTLATELAVQWALRGLRVLAIDLDTQGNLTQMMGYDPELEYDPSLEIDRSLVIEHNFGSLFTLPPILPTPTPLADVIKKPFGEDGPHIIPADVTLANLEDALANAPVRDFQIMRLLDKGINKPTETLNLSNYEILLFDAPPNINMITNTTLMAADICISPVALDALSFKGLTNLGWRLQTMVENVGRSPAVIVVPTFFRENRKRVTEIMDRLQSNYNHILSTSMIRETEEYKRFGVERELPVSLAAPNSKVAVPDLQNLSDELLTKISMIIETNDGVEK